jgi:hypothetical protein
MASVVSATAAEEWVVRREDSGPSTRVRVKYRSSTIEPYAFTFRGWCINGSPAFDHPAD